MIRAGPAEGASSFESALQDEPRDLGPARRGDARPVLGQPQPAVRPGSGVERIPIIPEATRGVQAGQEPPARVQEHHRLAESRRPDRVVPIRSRGGSTSEEPRSDRGGLGAGRFRPGDPPRRVFHPGRRRRCKTWVWQWARSCGPIRGIPLLCQGIFAVRIDKGGWLDAGAMRPSTLSMAGLQ